MAVQGNSSAGYFANVAPFTTQFGSITGWGRRASLAVTTNIATVSQSANANAAVSCVLRGSATQMRTIVTDDAGVQSIASASVDVGAQWNFCASMFTSTTQRDAFMTNALGGLQTGTNATAATTAAFDRLSVGCLRVNTTVTGVFAASDMLGSVAFWNRPLSATETKALSAGKHPADVAIDALVYYFPLKSNAVCERTGLELTLTGTAPLWFPTWNPPVRPRIAVRRTFRAPSAGGFNPAWAAGSNILLGTRGAKAA